MAEGKKADRAYRYLTRAFVFVVVLVALVAAANSFLQPIWFYENNYHTYRSFYEEPPNSIETVFVGASMTLFGFSPMEMYAQDGICAYNLASTSQPMVMSYFWVKEADRLQGDTLDTVVLDVSMLRRTPKEEDYRKALDGMDSASPVKREAIEALSDGPLDYLSYQFPILGYHDRWSQIDYTDFLKYGGALEDYARGYNMEFSRIFDQYSIEEIPVPAQVLDPKANPQTFEKESLYYLNQLIEFCRDQGIHLVLCKTPSPSNWASSDHNGVQEIADAYGLEFVDYEMEPLLSEIGYCPPLDSKDTSKHLNYYGAMKLSHHMSTYLSEVCGNRDFRGVEGYERLDQQLERYNAKVTRMAEATMATDIADFLEKTAAADNYTVLISVKDEASRSLTAAQRLAFSRLGLEELSTLGYRDSYLAVITGGKVECEEIERESTAFSDEMDKYLKKKDRDEQPLDLDQIEEGEWDDDEEEHPPITHSGTFADGVTYTLKSGGYNLGYATSCLIDDVEYAIGDRGMNVVVYDNDSHRVIYRTKFDTCGSSEREDPNVEASLAEARAGGARYSKLTKAQKRLYRYNRRMEYGIEAKTLRLEVGPAGLYKYLRNFCRDGLIVLVAVRGTGTNGLTAEARTALAGLGFSGIEWLGGNESYCAAVEDGTLVAEERGAEGEPTMLERSWYTIASGAYGSGDLASIVIDDNGYSADYAQNVVGYNIVVYNPKLDIVVDRASFNPSNGVDLY